MGKRRDPTFDKATRDEEEGAAIALCLLAGTKTVSVWMGKILAHQVLEHRLYELEEDIRKNILRRYKDAVMLAETVLD